jgi:di/tricarboxylate transporter
LSRHAHLEPTRDLRFLLGDILTVAGLPERIDAATAELVLQPTPMTARDLARLDRDLGVAVVMIHPESELVGKTLAEASFRAQHDLHVAGIRREGDALPEFGNTKLKPSDALLVMGPWTRIAALQSVQRDFVLLTLPSELATAAPARERLPIALMILAAMVVVSAFGLVPVVTSALAAAVLMVITRCVPMAEAYRGIQWSSLVLIGGMLSLAEALGRTGALQLGVENAKPMLMGMGLHATLAVVYLASTAIGSIVSNSATAALMGPIAISLAEALGYPPQAFGMTVALAASSAYLTPMASPVTSLVVEPGGYGLGDFFRAGLPMTLATLLITVFLVPVLF